LQQSAAFPWQQSLACSRFFDVGQHALPQSPPHSQPLQSQALQLQSVHFPSAQPHSWQSQALPQQQAATVLGADSSTEILVKPTVAANPMASAAKIVMK
jgi:hypothetical protein